MGSNHLSNLSVMLNCSVLPIVSVSELQLKLGMISVSFSLALLLATSLQCPASETRDLTHCVVSYAMLSISRVLVASLADALKKHHRRGFLGGGLI